MEYLVIVDITPNKKIAKHQSYTTRAEADAHVERVKNTYSNAFVKDDPGFYIPRLTTVDVVAKTIVFDYAAFEAEKAMKVWKEKMLRSTSKLPDSLEDLITANSLVMTPEIKTRYDTKIELRATKP